MSDVQPEVVSFLWDPYVPLAKLTFLEGDPAAGKTWLSLGIAAALSNGSGLPSTEGGGRPAVEPRDVLLLTCEDGLGDTVRVRLDALGADPRRVHVLAGVAEGTEERPATLEDVGVIEAAVEKIHAALVIIDPIQGFLGGKVDMHRANEVRPVLAGLARLAERQGCAVICIRHLAKASSSRALYRGLGSIDFTAAARSVLLAGLTPSGARAVVHLKSSAAKEGAAQGYTLTEEGGFAWTGPSDFTAQDLVAAEVSGEERDALADACEFLRESLRSGSRKAKEILADARGAGIAERTLRRARKKLGVIASRESTPGASRGAGAWDWTLPPQPED